MIMREARAEAERLLKEGGAIELEFVAGKLVRRKVTRH